MTINNLKELCSLLKITWEEFGNLDWWIDEDYVEEYGQIIIILQVCTEEWAYTLKTSQLETYWEKTR
jgi:hypothetical protein